MIVLLAVLAACGGGAEVGESCEMASECEEGLQCLCPVGPIPGTCSRTCSAKADCDGLGDNMSCVANFCAGVNLCLPNYSGSGALP